MTFEEYVKRYRELLEIRKSCVYIMWDEPFWDDIFDLICNHMDYTIRFLKEECTEDEFSFLSEIFDEIVEKTNSKEFIDTLYELTKKYPEETEKYRIIECIKEAEYYLDMTYEEYVKRYRELLDVRKSCVYIMWDEPFWDDIFDLICNHMDYTIRFLKEECTEDEFSFLSEIFDEIVEKTNSKEFIDTLYELTKKYPEETEKYRIVKRIKEAECFLDSEPNNNK